MPVFGAGGFNVHHAWEISGPLDRAALAESLRDVAYRHDALRVRIVPDQDETRQCLTTHVPRMRTLDLSHLGAVDAGVEASRVAAEEAATPFDCAAGSLFRALLIALAPNRHLLVYVFHHSIFDAISHRIWQRDVTAIYRHRSTGYPLELDPAPSYAAVVAGQQAHAARHRSYWASQVAKMPARLDLPVASREPINVLRPDVVPLAVSRRSVDRVTAMCERLRITTSACPFGAFAALIARSAREPSIGLDVLLAGRLTPQERGAIGMFVTDLYVWADLSGDPTVAEFLARMHAANAEALMHSPCPADLMPLSNDVPVINYFPRSSRQGEAAATFLDEALESREIPLSPPVEVVTPAGSTGASISMTLSETEGGLEGWLAYSHGRYERADVERLARDFELLLDAMPDCCEARLDEIPLGER